MKIELSSQQRFQLAKHFAEIIIGRVRTQRLELIGYPRGTEYSYRDVQDSIRSVTDRFERISFLSEIHYHIFDYRKHNDFPVHGRDFVKAVRLAELRNSPAVAS